MKTTKMIFKNKVLSLLWMLLVLSLFQVSPLMAENANNTLRDSSVPSSTWVLPASQWEAGQSGNHILKMPVLKSLMHSWIVQYDANNLLGIELRYPGGEEGELWVQALADWLVSMGMPSKMITMVPGSGTEDEIQISLFR